MEHERLLMLTLLLGLLTALLQTSPAAHQEGAHGRVLYGKLVATMMFEDYEGKNLNNKSIRGRFYENLTTRTPALRLRLQDGSYDDSPAIVLYMETKTLERTFEQESFEGTAMVFSEDWGEVKNGSYCDYSLNITMHKESNSYSGAVRSRLCKLE